jgi:GTP-binding protein EngB required for normal cell division
MKQWLDSCGIPNAVVLTKTDKLSSNALTQALKKGAEILNTREIVAFSAVTGLGKEPLLSRIGEAIVR